MEKVIVYLHGKGGSAAEAEHYKPLFPGWNVLGLDYKADTPWDAKAEFTTLFQDFGCFSLIANSLGAYFAMQALRDFPIEQAYFISPVVDMEKLILGKLVRLGVMEAELREKTQIGELSWQYLSFVRENPIQWCVPTHILYGERDTLTTLDTITAFSNAHGATLTVMPGGEHWFHTKEQMAFLDAWLREKHGAVR